MTQSPFSKTEKLGVMRGFSLIELAIVMTILGILLSGLLVAIGQSSENTRRITARNELRDFMEVLYGFAQTNGRLPCPASDASNGLEAPVGGGDCTIATGHGLLPAATLNMTGRINNDGLILDPWGNPYRYSVSIRDASNGERAFTHTSGMDQFFNANELSAVTMLRVCDVNSCGVNNILADMVPAIVLSMGSNWGDYSSNNEIENAGNPPPTAPNLGSYRVTTTSDFVSTEYSEENFDDLVVWLSPHVLFSKMISAGKLP